MENSEYQFYLFGSFLMCSDYRDIDILIVVNDIEDIKTINSEIANLRKKYPNSIVHTHIYLQEEYFNSKNKLNYEKVNCQISAERFLELFANEPSNIIIEDKRKKSPS